MQRVIMKETYEAGTAMLSGRSQRARTMNNALTSKFVGGLGRTSNVLLRFPILLTFRDSGKEKDNGARCKRRCNISVNSTKFFIVVAGLQYGNIEIGPVAFPIDCKFLSDE